MKSVKVLKDFTLNGVKYVKDDEIKDIDYQTLIKLNEKGFIYPLNYKELVMFERMLKNKREREEF